MASREDFDWDKIFEGATWFHFTGITPALSDACAEICLDAVKKAKEKGLTVSCDLNYRKNQRAIDLATRNVRRNPKQWFEVGWHT